MDRIVGANTIDLGGGRRGFRGKDTVAGVPGTELAATWHNQVQEEIVRLIELAGFVPSGAALQLAPAIQSGKLNWIGNFGGTANALTATLAPAPAALTPGLAVVGLFSATNDSAVTFNLNPFGPIPVAYNADGSPLRRSEQRSGEIGIYRYDGAVWRFIPSSVRSSGGRKNAIINPSWAVSQRNGPSYTGGVLAAGVYGFDRWKAGSGGCTFSMAGGAISITAGTLVQVVEAPGYVRGDMTLSWSGTAQARANGGAYAASPITVNIAANANVTLEWGTGTVSLPQFEPGQFATAFETREFTDEVNLCRRYCEIILHAQRFTAANANDVLLQTLLLVPKPASPTVTVSAAGSLTNVASAVGSGAANYAMTLAVQAAAAGVCEVASRVLTVTSEL